MAAKRADGKVGKVLHEFKAGTLHSGSGAAVQSRKQAIAIGLSEAREAGEKVKPPKMKTAAGRKAMARLRRSG